ncbi:Tubulin-specific chaperone D-like protein [Hapsidospora chrysogenum ATCC 11550]|uniref:Tubulin-specific chaperone D-like protein n=1 Tax=Hapsidospora chrysogenum (strain ATCC 11550 / CBS 779.69 / DSM 880 / IAM 14645 / JCM 23072 / IMI 49137) TaxID=857340 RepID=A0A086SUQ3_HAPC1|nr:Tubulin-specific chaperone D-like protein [Hapsidospora chrysogenum ATCC 11550]
MDAPEADVDITLQKVSADLISDFDRFLPTFLRKPEANGSSRVRSRVRAREVDWATNTCLGPFQELPQLLDPHLPKWVPFLSEAYLQHTQAMPREKKRHPDRAKHLVTVEYAICKILYTLCKIRGEKVIVRFLNVETRYLEVLLTAIEEAEENVVEDGDAPAAWSWEQRYIVLLWLSHLLLAPFDLSTISSVDLEDVRVTPVPGLKLPENLPGITLRLIPLAIKYLASPGKERDGAKALLVRTAMRRDMQQLGVLECLVQWSLAALRPRRDEPPEATYSYLGVLSFLAGILRSSSDTSDMNDFLRPIFTTVHGIASDEHEASKTIISFALARKMILKVIRSTIVSLLRQGKDDLVSTEMTETAIGYLLESLSDNDTPVRFAASKSLSIITLKLDPDMASQVVEAVLESLNRNVLWKKSKSHGEKSVRDIAAVDHLEWHGLMLTLSHLLYRRSPPAEQLSDIIHALLLGLSFEQRGTSGTSVGSNVRDAACFGIWALARRYTTQELLAMPTHSVFAAKAHPASSSIVQVLGTELVATASLDPAGNIRRGASAALQELIGRHPDTVEKGIWVVQAVDYHTVARRSRAMGEVAVSATKLSTQYGEAIVDGILGWRGIGDVDAASRRDAGAALGVLTLELASEVPDDPFRRFEDAVELITDRLASLEKRQVEERHGLLLCFAAVLDQFPALFQKAGHGGDQLSRLRTGLIRNVLSAVTPILADCKATTYRRPELIAESASRLVVSLFPLLQAAVLRPENLDGLQTMEQLLSHAASKGYSSLVSSLDSSQTRSPEVGEFLSSLKGVLPLWLARNEPETLGPVSSAALTLLIFSTPGERATIMSEWAASVRHKPTTRKTSQGEGHFYALAIAQPLVKTIDNLSSGDDDVVCEAILGRWREDAEVETRVAILQALTRSRILHDRPLDFLDVLSDGLDDYTTTARGDVGSHVRVQALRAVKELWVRIDEASDRDTWVTESVKALFYGALRLSAEKLDRVRPEAQGAVSLVLKGRQVLPLWPSNFSVYSEELRSMTFSSQTYFQALLDLVHRDSLHPAVSAIASSDGSKWMAELMAGFVTSADTGNEDLVIASRAALTVFCSASPANLSLVCNALLRNLKERQGQDRVIVPTLEIVAFLFHVGLFQCCEDVDMRSLCLQTQKAGYKTGNVRKIEACVRVYGGVAAMGGGGAGVPGAQEARKRLGALLFHPWPKVRTMVVDELWGLVGDQGRDGDRLTGVDWGKAQKGEIRAVVHELRLE